MKRKGKEKHKYFLINKPFNVLSQFTDSSGRQTLGDIKSFPKDVYPVGRLDYDSEGLLLLTNNRLLIDKLLNPKYNHEKEYLVQVEGILDKIALKKLSDGVLISGYKTKPAKVELLTNPPKIWERNKPIRFRANIPTSWIKITISEGKNRQVRKMTATVGHPTLRLIRTKICNLKIGNLLPGQSRELSEKEIFLLIERLKLQ